MKTFINSAIKHLINTVSYRSLPSTLLPLILGLSLSLVYPSAFAEKKEPSNGHEMHEEIIGNMPIVEGKLADYVKKVGQRIASNLTDSKETFTFTVIDSPDINAFAIEDGYVYINRGLITYLKSEAQLAAVLAHEVGHVTANHHGRGKRAQIGSTVVSSILAVLTRSRDVGEASALWGASFVSGYGREMELEADELGGRYLFQSGYDPQAMIEVISVLKDHERLEKKRAQESGKKAQTYHGLFSTHPRNDKRLREVVSKSGKLPKKLDAEKNITPFRVATEGMIWGKSYKPNKTPENAYQNDNLAFQIYFPKEWSHTSNTNSNPLVVAKNADNNVRMKVTVMARTLDTPDQFIKKQLNIPLIKKAESFIQSRLSGHTGFVPEKNGADQRIAVIYYGRRAYIFRGEIDSNVDGKQANKDLLNIIRSFRPISKRSLATQKPKTIHYVKATKNTSFSRLAKHLKIGKYGEDELRIINGYYPVGEPKPGEWIKLIR
jgi:predicted Zn-dependent protease